MILENDPSRIVNMLSESQKKCISDLDVKWKSTGYSKIDADILYSIGGERSLGRFETIVECDLFVNDSRSYNYSHRLSPLGYLVKLHLNK